MDVEHLTKQNHDLEEQLAKGMLGPIVTERSKRAPTSKGRTKRQQCSKQTRATRYQPSIRRRNGTIAHGYRDTDDEGTDELHDERLQRMSVKQP